MKADWSNLPTPFGPFWAPFFYFFGFPFFFDAAGPGFLPLHPISPSFPLWQRVPRLFPPNPYVFSREIPPPPVLLKFSPYSRTPGGCFFFYFSISLFEHPFFYRTYAIQNGPFQTSQVVDWAFFSSESSWAMKRIFFQRLAFVFFFFSFWANIFPPS